MSHYEKHFQMMREPCELYRHFAADGSLLYVGIARSARRRKYQHKCGADWAHSIATTKVEAFDSRDKAVAAEAMAITFERPAYNAKRPLPRGVPPSIRSEKCPVMRAMFGLPERRLPPRYSRKSAIDYSRFDYVTDLLETVRNWNPGQ